MWAWAAQVSITRALKEGRGKGWLVDLPRRSPRVDADHSGGANTPYLALLCLSAWEGDEKDPTG